MIGWSWTISLASLPTRTSLSITPQARLLAAGFAHTVWVGVVHIPVPWSGVPWSRVPWSRVPWSQGPWWPVARLVAAAPVGQVEQLASLAKSRPWQVSGDPVARKYNPSNTLQAQVPLVPLLGFNLSQESTSIENHDWIYIYICIYVWFMIGMTVKHVRNQQPVLMNFGTAFISAAVAGKGPPPWPFGRGEAVGKHLPDNDGDLNWVPDTKYRWAETCWNYPQLDEDTGTLPRVRLGWIK